MGEAGELTRETLQELFGRGDKIEAVQLNRGDAGVGLAEANRAAEELGKGIEASPGSERTQVRPTSVWARVIMCASVVLLTLGCITSAKVQMMTDRELPPSDAVTVLRAEPEDREFELIATLRLDLVRYDEEFAISRFKKRAMEIGADAIVVREPQTRDIPGAYLPAEPGRDVMSIEAGNRRVLVTALALRFTD